MEQTENILHGYIGKRVLITGGAGYIAANVVELLKNVDCSIVRLDRSGAKFSSVVGKAKVTDLGGDMCERTSWEKELDNVDFIFHFAAQTSVYTAHENPPADLNVNVLPMLHLLETCRAKDRYPVILFSSTVTIAGIPVSLPVSEAHPDCPITIYDLHKWMSESYLEHYVRQGDVRGASLRLANVYGPGPKSGNADRGVLNSMIRRALAGEELTIYGAGDFMRDYIYVEDVAWAFLLAGQRIEAINGQHFIIGSGQGSLIADTLNKVADRAAYKTGQRVKVTHVPPPPNLSPVESRNFVADSRRFIQMTGWRPTCSLVEGIDRTIEALA
jgi:nucleoside-diphosphate-sugar epimerase